MVVFLGGVVYNKFLKIFVSPQGPANKDWEPVCCFLGGGGVVYNKFLKIFVSPQGPANKDWEPVCCFGGGVVCNKFLKIFVSPQGPANKDWEPVCCFGGGVGEELRRNSSKIESYKSVSEITWVPKQTTSKL